MIKSVMMYSRPYFDSVKARVNSELGQDLMEYALWSGVIAIGLILVGSALYFGIGTTLGTAIKDCVDFDTGTDCGPLG